MTTFPEGLGGGLETTRSYVTETFPTGSKRSVTRWLTSLVGREDVVRVWLQPIGSKSKIWEHLGPLEAAPDLDALFAVDSTESVAA